MILPQLHGELKQDKFFIFAACDDVYFDDFGEVIINSIKKNTSTHLHLHIYNPRDDQLLLIERLDQVSISYEFVALEAFETAAKRWLCQPPRHIKNPGTISVQKKQNTNGAYNFIYNLLNSTSLKWWTPTNLEYSKYKSTISAMRRGSDKNICDRMRKTYYACSRFIRLNQLLTGPASFLAIDVDAVVRKELEMLPSTYDFFFHRIHGVNARFLAGGLYCNKTTNCLKFLDEYSDVLQDYIRKDYLYWGLDQIVLEDIVPKYNWGELPRSYADWFMELDSFIWTAKGARKESSIFINEQKKYSY